MFGRIDCAAFAHREMVRRIKRLRGKIAERAGRASPRSFVTCKRAERVAIVFDQPEIVRSQKSENGMEIERIAQSMCHITALVLPAQTPLPVDRRRTLPVTGSLSMKTGTAPF